VRPIPSSHSVRDDKAFWADVSITFPSLKGAASKAYYFECERSLFEEFLPHSAGRLLLKTDLWDEAKKDLPGGARLRRLVDDAVHARALPALRHHLLAA